MTKQKVAKKSSSSAKHKVSGGGGGAHQKVLNVAAAMKTRFKKDSIERKKLSALTGIHGKSTIANALTKLKNLEWVDVSPNEITITDLGMKNADADAVDQSSIPKTNAEYIESVVQQHKLKPAAAVANSIDVLKDGRTYRKKELAEKINMKMNSTYANLMTNLKKAGIAEYVGKDEIRLTDDMFRIEPRPAM